MKIEECGDKGTQACVMARSVSHLLRRDKIYRWLSVFVSLTSNCTLLCILCMFILFGSEISWLDLAGEAHQNYKSKRCSCFILNSEKTLFMGNLEYYFEANLKYILNFLLLSLFFELSKFCGVTKHSDSDKIEFRIRVRHFT